MIIAVDFDGTIVEDKYPEIGAFRPGAVETLKKLKKEGYLLVLWTCRTGKHLAQAVNVCATAGIRFDAINANPRSEIVKYNGSDPRKVGASVYVDDRGIGGIGNWDEIYAAVHRRVPTAADMVDLEFSV